MAGKQERIERRLAAIFAADVAGYSRLMAEDEVATLRDLTAHREVMDRLIGEHGGRIANTAGDSVLAEFPSAVDAVQCAVEVQNALAALIQSKPADRALRFRVGIHIGDVMVRGGDLLGDGVNIAARLEALAEPGSVCISGDVHRHVRKVLPVSFTDLGPQKVKNIEEPVQVFSIQAVRRQPSSPDKSITPKLLSLPDKPSIAVLPFTNMSGDAEQDYFADGVVEDILTALARFPTLRVAARNSSFIYKGRAVDLREVGQTLGVRYALEGSVRKSVQRIRIVAQLIETQTGMHIWADKLDGDFSDIFALQDEITEKVVTAIEPRLKLADIERSARARTSDLGAYDLYLRALAAHHRMDREGLGDAIDLLKRCLDLDPRYGAAASLYSISQAQLVALGGVQDPKSAVAEVLRYARMALDLNKDDPDAIAWAGRVIAWATDDFDTAMNLVNRAVEANPNSANVWCQRGWVLVYAQRPAGALPDFERALKIGPLDLALFDTLAGQANAYLILDRFQEAVPAAYAAMAQNPRYASACRVLVASLAHLGRLDEARAAAKGLLEIDPGFTITSWIGRAGAWQSRQMVEGLRLAGLPE